ncbi:hypothetical protein J1N35_008711 [Gossypium stocksii]|uniref:Uncharacterized protein n=1 Tax=Gossypium stocksii TaxID=47602 RepID=A0A9D4AGQ6_9ROSI|nr:hypothetical protein J1N35_008711 [Gossypium stocksii]
MRQLSQAYTQKQNLTPPTIEYSWSEYWRKEHTVGNGGVLRVGNGGYNSGGRSGGYGGLQGSYDGGGRDGERKSGFQAAFFVERKLKLLTLISTGA